MKWWKDFNHKEKWVMYSVGNTNFFVGYRPDISKLSKKTLKKIDAFLSVTETYIEYPDNKITAWMPWIEESNIPLNTLFGSLKTLNNWFLNPNIKNIYIHCDLGSHRAPSIFGAFLYTYIDNPNKVVRNFKLSKNNNYHWSSEKKKLNSNPLKYFENKCQFEPKLPYICQQIKKNNDLRSILFDLEDHLPDHLLSEDKRIERKNKKAHQTFIKGAKQYIEKNYKVLSKDSKLYILKNDIQYRVCFFGTNIFKPPYFERRWTSTQNRVWIRRDRKIIAKDHLYYILTDEFSIQFFTN